MFEWEHTVADSEVEAEYNHVHHATAMFLLEQSRLAFIASVGFPNPDLIERELFLVIATLRVIYKRELLLNDELLITCENPRIENRSLFVDQRVIKERGRVAVEAEVELKCMCGRRRRAIIPPADFLEAFVGSK